jgi:hypothetical protein
MIEPTPYQAKSLLAPETINQIHAGGRGGGKTMSCHLEIVRHCQKYKERAHVLVIRKSYPGLTDFERSLHHTLVLAFSDKTRFNGQDHIFRMPNGSTIELRCYQTEVDFESLQGREATLIVVDEVGQYGDPSVLFLLRSLLRGPEDIPRRMIWACNPGGVGHQWLWTRFISTVTPWRPFVDAKTNTQWILCPSTYTDNPHIDRIEYKRDLVAATAHDPELGKAWISGDWDIERGAYFAGCLNESKVAIDPALWTPERLREVLAPPTPQRPPEPGSVDEKVNHAFATETAETLSGDPPPGWLPGFQLYLAMDFGVSAPSVCYVMARSRGCQGPDGFYYPKGSIVALDEWTHARPGRLNEGSGLSVPTQAEEIKAMCSRWRMSPRGCGDDAMFSRQRGHDVATIADEFRECGVRLEPAKKGSRVAGWSLMRSMLMRAGSIDEPALYLSRTCEYAWTTLPFLDRDPRHPEDLATDGPDHGADALRYGILWKPPHGITVQKISNYF